MALDIAYRTLLDSCLVPAGIHDQRLIRAMCSVPRHRFVPAVFQRQAYFDDSLPIGFKQTISKPSVVARMLQCAGLKMTERVLEVGTGSGYQTAILSRLVRRVYSVDVVEAFVQKAKRLLAELDCCNVTVRLSDGRWGLEEEAPFDAIVVSACADEIPEALVSQLNPEGGRLILPLKVGREQRIRVVVRHGKSQTEMDLGPCVFVPLVSWKSG